MLQQSFHSIIPSGSGPTEMRDVYTCIPSVPLTAYIASNMKREQLSAHEIVNKQHLTAASLNTGRLAVIALPSILVVHSVPFIGRVGYNWP